MAKLKSIFDDQVLLNEALDALDISWTRVRTQYDNSSNNSLSSSERNTAWVGHTPVGLKVTLLPQGVACRGEGCVEEVRESVYVWHRGANRHKFGTMSHKAGQDGVWFLRQDWERAEAAGSGGVQWLSRIQSHSHET